MLPVEIIKMNYGSLYLWIYNIRYISYICRKFQEAEKRLVSLHIWQYWGRNIKKESPIRRERKKTLSKSRRLSIIEIEFCFWHMYYIYRLYHTHIHLIYIYIMIYIYIKFIINIVFVWVLDFVNNFSPYTCVNFLESLLHTNISSNNV